MPKAEKLYTFLLHRLTQVNLDLRAARRVCFVLLLKLLQSNDGGDDDDDDDVSIPDFTGAKDDGNDG